MHSYTDTGFIIPEFTPGIGNGNRIAVSVQINQISDGAASPVIFDYAVFNTAVDQLLSRHIRLEINSRLRSGSTGIADDAIPNQQIFYADDGNALPMVIIYDNIFNMNVGTVFDRFGRRVSVADVNAVAAAGFQPEIPDRDMTASAGCQAYDASKVCKASCSE